MTGMEMCGLTRVNIIRLEYCHPCKCLEKPVQYCILLSQYIWSTHSPKGCTYPSGLFNDAKGKNYINLSSSSVLFLWNSNIHGKFPHTGKLAAGEFSPSVTVQNSHGFCPRTLVIILICIWEGYECNQELVIEESHQKVITANTYSFKLEPSLSTSRHGNTNLNILLYWEHNSTYLF